MFRSPFTTMVVEVLCTVHQLLFWLKNRKKGDSKSLVLVKELCWCCKWMFYFFIEEKCVTRGMSFPVLMAVTDSKQPVVEKVQQLPQVPCSVRKHSRLIKTHSPSPPSAACSNKTKKGSNTSWTRKKVQKKKRFVKVIDNAMQIMLFCILISLLDLLN